MRLIPFDLYNFEIAYFLLRLSWICSRSDFIGTEGWDDENITSGDDQNACSNVETN